MPFQVTRQVHQSMRGAALWIVRPWMRDDCYHRLSETVMYPVVRSFWKERALPAHQRTQRDPTALGLVRIVCVRGNYVNVDTVRLSHILDTDEFLGLHYFLAHTALVVCHKHERLETLLGVLWYLPVHSPILVVTNCPEAALGEIKRGLAEQLPRHSRIYVIHQKDAFIAQFFRERGVQALLNAEGAVVDGKGEGMYIGTLYALLLGYPEWASR